MIAFKNQIKKASLYMAMATVFSIPFGIRPLVYFIGLWAVAVLAGGAWTTNWRKNMNTRSKRHYFLLFVVFYIINIIGLIYSLDKKQGLYELQIKFSILLVPVLFAVSNKWEKKNIQQILYAFIAGVILSSLICYFAALYHSVHIVSGKVIFSVHPEKSPWDNYFNYSDFSFMLHPSYFAMYIGFVLVLLLDTFSSKEEKIISVNKYVSVTLLIFLSVTLFLLSSRAGLLTWFVVFVLFFLRKFKDRNGISDIFYVLFPLLLVVGLFIYILINGSRMKVIHKELETAEKIDDARYPGSVALRIILWQDAWRVIKAHPWVGTGTGSTEKSLYADKSGVKYTWPEKMQLNVHNQFLETWLEQGIFALLILLTIIFYPLFRKKIPYRYMLNCLGMIILINFMFESMLDRIHGVAFFAIFYMLFALTPENKQEIATGE